VGNAVEPATCERVADELNRRGFAVPATIEALDVVRYEHDSVRTVARVALR
jgi:hypothetical protein